MLPAARSIGVSDLLGWVAADLACCGMAGVLHLVLKRGTLACTAKLA